MQSKWLLIEHKCLNLSRFGQFKNTCFFIGLSLLFFFIISKKIQAKHFAADLTIYTEHLSPFQIVNSDNDITGLATEIVRTALKRSSINYKIEAYAWSISYQLTLKNKNSCLYSLARNEARENTFFWLDLNTGTKNSLYSLADKNISIANLDQAKQYTTAVIKDDVTHHYFIEQGFSEGNNLYVYDNYKTLLKFFQARKNSIDFIVLNDDLLKNRVKNSLEFNKYKKVFLIEALSLQFYLGCNINTPKTIIEKLDKSLQLMHADGTTELIKQKWLPYFK